MNDTIYMKTQTKWMALCMMVSALMGRFIGVISHKHLIILIQHFYHVVMLPPLGAGGIMFSGCPSVRPSEAWNTLIWPVHGSVGPPDQSWPFYGMSVCPSVHLSVRPSVRPERFPGICGRTHWGNGLKFICWCILTIFRTDKFMVTVCWFF